MAKFIRLTDCRRGSIFALNANTIELMYPRAEGGTNIITTTNHTKYVVKESMDDILAEIEKPTANPATTQE